MPFRGAVVDGFESVCCFLHADGSLCPAAQYANNAVRRNGPLLQVCEALAEIHWPSSLGDRQIALANSTRCEPLGSDRVVDLAIRSSSGECSPSTAHLSNLAM